MTVKKYRKKPVVIEAIEFTLANFNSIMDFTEADIRITKLADGYCELVIKTLEGDMKASIGDYIIKGVNGEFYSCKPDVFEKTYEFAEAEIK